MRGRCKEMDDLANKINLFHMFEKIKRGGVVGGSRTFGFI